MHSGWTGAHAFATPATTYLGALVGALCMSSIRRFPVHQGTEGNSRLDTIELSPPPSHRARRAATGVGGAAVWMAVAHGTNDGYMSFLAPLLPRIMEKLELSIALAAVLAMTLSIASSVRRVRSSPSRAPSRASTCATRCISTPALAGCSRPRT